MSDLALHVRRFVPSAEGEELAHRITLLKVREYACALRGSTLSDCAYAHACEADAVAGDYVYARVPPATLEHAAHYCRYLLAAAKRAEILDSEGDLH